MMSVKGGTQTWSTSQQTSALKAPSERKEAALPSQPDAENLGEIANKIADPNWVDPSKMRRVGGNELDKDAFLKLMLTQMKNQDPTNPLQSHEMAAQLAQFTSLEQLFNINESLGDLKKAQDPNKSFDVLQMIGKSVAGDSSKIIRGKGDKEHDIEFTLPSAASQVEVKVRNSNGEVVRKYDLKNLKEGANRVSWNGTLENGNEARPGEYNVVIEAKASNGAKIVPQTAFEGRITGVNFTSTGPVLMIGKQSVRLSDVKKIVDPQLASGAEKDQRQKTIAVQDLAKKADTGKNKVMLKPESGRQDTSEMTGNLENVVMSGDLADKLKKESSAE